MRKILYFVYSTFLIILIANFIYYKSLYNKQINYIIELLDRQVQIVGLSVDNTNNGFLSDVNKIIFTEDLALFFTNPDNQFRAKERMKLFFSKYQNLVTGIKFYDDNKNEFSLKKDIESATGEWLEQSFKLHVQPEIFSMEKPEQENRKFDYYLPVIKDEKTIGNIVVTVDYKKYFTEIFSEFNLKDYQWQWVLSDSGSIIYDNFESKIEYSNLERITADLARGSIENIIHNATVNGKRQEIISSYYSTQLLQKDLGIVFSAPIDFFQKYIVKNSIFIVLGTLLLILMIINIFWRYLKSQKSEIELLKSSEKMLIKMIEDMPVGVVIHNKNRKILKANKVAANQYSYGSEDEMQNKIFPETTLPDDNDYFSKHLGGTFDSDQFVILKKEIGEMVLYRNSLPVVFMGENATMEILIDITKLESARKQEAKANVAKSEFLTRMSYEIRTPLTGIIGMTDVLKRYDLSTEISELVTLLHRSAEVLLGIINDILDFSKIESGEMILDEVPFDPRNEINYCIELARTRISGDNLKILFTVDQSVPESIIGDPFRLRQILICLLNHSVKNTDDGEIHLRCAVESSENRIITLGFELTDTGISFDKASLDKIFGDFPTLESKSVRSGDDSGFGTILAKQLVELMGGKLYAESPSGISGGKGTKVSFTLPACSNDRQIKDLPFEQIKSYEEIKTLVIIGNPTRDNIIMSALHELGLTVRITTFMKSTINQIRTNLNYPDDRYNLVIIFDQQDFNGFDVASEIWENNLSGNFIILMISSNNKKGNYLKCISMGVDHYLIKPFEISELLSKIKNSFPFLKDSSLSADFSSARKDINILIVEDNRMNQIVLGTMLNNLGYIFDVANDGQEGYIRAKTRKYDLIFMDLIMPEMDGFEASQKILGFDKSVIIIAFTADNMPESKRKAELSGIKDFISKPLRIDDLKKLFTRYFSK